MCIHPENNTPDIVIAEEKHVLIQMWQYQMRAFQNILKNTIKFQYIEIMRGESAKAIGDV